MMVLGWILGILCMLGGIIWFVWKSQENLAINQKQITCSKFIILVGFLIIVILLIVSANSPEYYIFSTLRK